MHRFALVAIALLALAWLSLGLRASRLEAEGRATVDAGQRGELSRAEIRDGLDALRRSRRFNEDNESRLAEAALLARAGRPEEAILVARRVVAGEPENLEGWVVLYLGAAVTDDRRLATRALSEISTLNPQLAERLTEQAQQGS